MVRRTLSAKFLISIGILIGIVSVYAFAIYFKSRPQDFQEIKVEANNDLNVADFRDKNLSQWVNDAGFITGVNYSEIKNSNGYLDYKPDNIACQEDQILVYKTSKGWVCGDDKVLKQSEVPAPIVGNNLAAGSTVNNQVIASQDWVQSLGFIKNDTSVPKNNLNSSGLLSFLWSTSELNSAVMIEGENISSLNNDAGYISGYSETDPTLNGWTGSSNITSLGTIVSGVWNGTPIISSYIQDGTISLNDIGQNSCSDTQTIKWNNTNSQWECSADDNNITNALWGNITGDIVDQTDISEILSGKLNTNDNFDGDISGTYGAIVVGDDSHSHTGTTISGLSKFNFTVENVSQWTNDAGYISGLDNSQIANGSGIYWNYKPNDLACTQDQILKYNTDNNAWVCGDDNNSGVAAGVGNGQLAIRHLPAAQVVSGIADLTDLTITQTLVAGRTYEWKFYGTGVKSSTATSYFKLTDENNNIITNVIASDTTGFASIASLVYREVGTGAAVTRKMRLEVDSGSYSLYGSDSLADVWLALDDVTNSNDTGLIENQVENFITNGVIDLAVNSTLGTNLIATHDWVNGLGFLTGIPDGTISLSKLGQNGCTDGQIMKWSDASNGWVCAEETAGGGGVSINYQQVVGTTDVSTTSVVFEDMPDMSITMNTTGGPVEVHFVAGSGHSISSGYTNYQLLIDGVKVQMNSVRTASASMGPVTAFTWIHTPTAGTHTYVVQWSTSTGTAYNRAAMEAESRVLNVKEYGVSGTGSGQILMPGQVASVNTIQTRAQDSYAVHTTGDGTEITPLNLVMTPKKAGNKVILEWVLNAETHWDTVFNIYRNGVLLANSNDGVNRWSGVTSGQYDNDLCSTPANMVIKIIDENSLNVETTYSILVRSAGPEEHTLSLNKSICPNQDNQEAMLSTGMATEINTGISVPNGLLTIGSMTGIKVFSDATADDQWLGLGAAAGRLEFDDQTIDELNFLDVNVGIGTSTPFHKLDVNGTIGLASDMYINWGSVDGETGYGLRDNSGTVQYKDNGGAWTNLSSGTMDYIILRDERPNGTEGGDAIANTWTARVINTETLDTGNNCTLAGNQFTLEAGTYDISAGADFYNTAATSIRLRNITDDVTTLLGVNTYAGNGAVVPLIGRFTIASTKTFEIQYISEGARSTYGVGVSTGIRASNFTENEIYLNAELHKLH